jgi:TonB family protein
MFETSVIRAGAMRPRNHYRFLTLSLAVHSCAVVVVITSTLISTKLPTEAPKQMEFPPIYRITPPLGTPDGGGRKPPAAPPEVKRVVTPPPNVVTAPPTIPDQTAVATTTPDATTSTSVDGGDASNLPGNGGPGAFGVPGGDPNSMSTTTTGPVSSEPLRAGIGDVKAPVVLQRVLPEYPRIALVARKNGWVIVECIIDRTGHIRNVKVVGSSFPPFEQPAIDAVQKWVFSPGTLRGEPVDTIFDLTVTFQVR